MNIFRRFTHKIKSFWNRFVAWVKTFKSSATIATSFVTSAVKAEVTLSQTVNEQQPLLDGQVQTVLTQVPEPNLFCENKDTLIQTSFLTSAVKAEVTPSQTVNALIIKARDPLIAYVEKQTDEEEQIEIMVALGSLHPVFRDSFKNELESRKITELMKYIVRGQEEQAKKMLERFPHLLRNNSAKVIDYSEREVKSLTPFQAALSAGDVGMCKMIQEIFQAHPEKTEGEIEMARQFAEVFPEKRGDSKLFPEAERGLEGHLERQKQNVFNFDAIVAAINKATSEEVTQALNKAGAQFTETEEARAKSNNDLTLTEALNRFREQFTQKSCNEIIFNLQHLLKAFEIYDAQFYAWDWNKRDLFWRQVIGFVQRFLPACDAQAFAQGVYDIVKNDEALQRSFAFRYNDLRWRIWYHSARFCEALGFDYAVSAGSAQAGRGPLCSWVAGASIGRWPFEKFISSKNIQFGKLIPPNQQQPTDSLRNSVK